MGLSSGQMRRRRLGVIAATALAGVAFAGCALGTDGEPTGRLSQASVCAAGTVVKGVDVSVYQGTIDWTSVKGAGIDFAIARISDGSALDTDFATNWSGMKSAGLVRGAYQYFEPGQDPTTQADIVISAVGMLGPGDLPVTADMETTGGESAATIAANLRTWMTAVQAGTGKAPMVYTAEGYWDSDVDSTAFASSPLWVANWGVTCPTLPTGWNQWVFWQDADDGTVAGISGAVDLDEYDGTLAQLQAFAGGSASADGGGGIYGATYVSQSWPLATTTMMMTTCQTLAASITFKNSGTLPWDSSTRLGTTQPRDRVSEFADSTWVSADRAAQVSGTVPPGGTYEFKFDFHAPPTTGTFTEYFGLVQDGVAWFSDPGQGGPADDDIEANIQVTAGSTSCTVDPGVPDGGGSADGGGKIGGGAPEGGGVAQGEGGSPIADEGGAASDAGAPAAAPTEGGSGGGCSCDAIGAGAAGREAWALVLVLGVLSWRKRR